MRETQAGRSLPHKKRTLVALGLLNGHGGKKSTADQDKEDTGFREPSGPTQPSRERESRMPWPSTRVCQKQCTLYAGMT